MRTLRKSLAGAAVVGAVLLATVGAADGANADTVSPAYHLYDKHDTAIMANCIHAGYIKSAGSVSISPRIYKNVRSEQDNGYFETDVTVEDGFNSAYKQLWCLNGDYMWRYYGKNKIQRTGYVYWYCAGLGCAALGTKTTAWVNKNWQ